MANSLIHDVRLLLRPRALPLLRRRWARGARSGAGRPMVLGVVGTLFWCGLFGMSWRVLRYFKGIEDIGDLLAYKLLSMILVVSFALLLFSGILTALARLFLSRDLLLVHALPVADHRIFIARWIDSTADSSWMVIVFAMPVFLAYGLVFGAGAAYYAITLLALFFLAVIASALSAEVVMLGVLIMPATRMRSVVILMGVLLFVVLYLAIRLMRPEQLVDPEVFDSVLVYISSLQAPASATATSLFHLALSASFAVLVFCMAVITADAINFRGFSKAQTAATTVIRRRGVSERIFRFLPGPVRAFTVKEIKTFLRDQTQWTQLFLIAALLVIYIYNFDALPLEKSPIQTVYLQNVFAFLNMGLALFVLTAVAARFAYPAVSLEKEAFWLIQSSPLSIRSFLLIKFFIYYLPLLALTETLIVGTNLLLRVTPFMMVLSTVTVFFLVPGIVAMGIGLGAAFPDFKAENPAQTASSFGGLVFMLTAAIFIAVVILLQAGPVYRLFMADLHGKPLSTIVWLWVVAAFSAAFTLSILAVILPLRFGEKRLSRIHL